MAVSTIAISIFADNVIQRFPNLFGLVVHEVQLVARRQRCIDFQLWRGIAFVTATTLASVRFLISRPTEFVPL